MTCKCGFRFAGPGEFRNCDAYVNNAGDGCVICPKCGAHYVMGKPKGEGDE